MKMRSLLIAITSLVFFGCSKDELNQHQQYVENVEVQFSTDRIITSSQNFSARVTEKMATAYATTQSTDLSYEHKLPNTFTAYFVAKETKGQYTKDQIVKEIVVNAGTNTIEVPKMNLHVYVTNYSKNGNWFTWPDAIEQMPMTSNEIYMIGDDLIDFNTVTEAAVEVFNPYAAVMIMNNQVVNGIPKSNDTNDDYTRVSDHWYNLYIRMDYTNTMVPISIVGNPNDLYTLNRPIEANKIYQFELSGKLLDNAGGNFKVIVKPLELTEKEEVNVW